jgi:stress response protein YsnF
VSEEVSLRDEAVRVERRPVDQPVTDANSARAFQDRTIEAEERHEEPVVAKEAHVKEEVVVGKTAEQHTETVKEKMLAAE